MRKGIATGKKADAAILWLSERASLVIARGTQSNTLYSGAQKFVYGIESRMGM